jgi:hypothetical protein
VSLIRGEAPSPRNIAKQVMRAREIAREGRAAHWADVLEEMRRQNKRAARTLLLWAGPMERDEIDRLCNNAKSGIGSAS